jgi:hypothetical protein
VARASFCGRVVSPSPKRTFSLSTHRAIRGKGWLAYMDDRDAGRVRSKLIDRAIELAPSDLRIQRASVLRALERQQEARLEFMRVLEMDSSSVEARAGLLSLQPPLKHELRLGPDTDLSNYTGAYEGQWASLASHWTLHWTTSVGGYFFQQRCGCRETGGKRNGEVA